MKTKRLVLLSIPGLRSVDLPYLPNLQSMTASGCEKPLVPSFPAVTCPVQTNMLTGVHANKHGVVANGFYLTQKDIGAKPPRAIRGGKEPCDVPPVWPNPERVPMVELWTMPNACIEAPQIWDTLKPKHVTSAVWFALMSKYCTADYVCNFAPIHNPDGTESLWCYTRPYLFYGELQQRFDHFPVKHYWGPLAGLPASDWIVNAAIHGAQTFKPQFLYVYIPLLDYIPQKWGPNAPQLKGALLELDTLFGKLRQELSAAYNAEPAWLVAGEYAITPVENVVYPNRVLRELGTIAVTEQDGKENLDVAKCKAFALCDHQVTHLFFNDHDPQLIKRVAERFRYENGVGEVLEDKDDLAKYGLDHRRSGQIVLAATPDSWFSYYFWEDDAKAPDYARTVDIHRKPGYDPVELFFDRATMSVPLDATLVKGSHGAPVWDASQKTVLLSSNAAIIAEKEEYNDVDVFHVITKYF